MKMSKKLFGALLDRMIERAVVADTSFRSLVECANLNPGSDFVGRTLVDIDLRDEDLRGFDFSYADLTGADFRGADITGVQFEGAILDDVIGISREPRSLLLVGTQWAKVMRIVEELGNIDVMHTTDPEKVPQLARENNFNLIMMESALGRFMGYDVIKWLKNDGINLAPVLVVTQTSATTSERERFQFAGAADIIKIYESRDEIKRIISRFLR